MDTKPKRQLTQWTAFCKKYYDENKAKFNNSYRDMLKSPELKQAYAQSKAAPVPAGGKMMAKRRMKAQTSSEIDFNQKFVINIENDKMIPNHKQLISEVDFNLILD